jgi:hypothetical protein
MLAGVAAAADDPWKATIGGMVGDAIAAVWMDVASVAAGTGMGSRLVLTSVTVFWPCGFAEAVCAPA